MSTHPSPRPDPSLPSDEPVLITLLKSRRDLDIAREQHWHSVPLRSAVSLPEPQHIGFYGTKDFGDESWLVRYWAPVIRREVVRHSQLFPDGPAPARAHQEYYKFHLGELHRLEQPILSRWQRRIVLIPTTRPKIQRAHEINDLFLGSALDEMLWEGFGREGLQAERQLCLAIAKNRYLLNFAFFCERGQINVECDSEDDHQTPEEMDAADARDDQLAHHNWSVLRFTSRAVREILPACLNLVRQTINRQGGLRPPSGPHPWYRAERG